MEERWPAAYATEIEIYDAFSRAEDEGNRLLNRLLEVFSFDGKRVLDVGCGTGKYIGLIAPLSEKYVAVDNSAGMVEVARDRSRGFTNVTILRCSAETLPFVTNSVDAVFSSWLISGILPEQARERAIAEVVRVLKPSGHIWLFENDRGGEFMRIRRRASAEWNLYHLDMMVEKYGFEIFERVHTNFCFRSAAETERVLGFLLGERAIEHLQRNPARRVEHNTLLLHKVKGTWT